MLTRKHALSALGAFGLSAFATVESTAAAESAVVGAWKLESFDILEKGGKRSPRYGADPVGYLMYSASGRVSAILSARDRHKLVPPPATISESDLACIESIRPFLAYAGTYRIRGNRVFHTVETSVFTNLVGTTLEREFSIAGDILTIRTLPPEIWGSGNELTWRRT
jgi:hypothetical protein